MIVAKNGKYNLEHIDGAKAFLEVHYLDVSYKNIDTPKYVRILVSSLTTLYSKIYRKGNGAIYCQKTRTLSTP